MFIVTPKCEVQRIIELKTVRAAYKFLCEKDAMEFINNRCIPDDWALLEVVPLKTVTTTKTTTITTIVRDN